MQEVKQRERERLQAEKLAVGGGRRHRAAQESAPNVVTST